MRIVSTFAAAACAVAVAACGASVDGTTTGRAGADATELVNVTPAARADIARATWDIFDKEPDTVDWIRTIDYSEGTVVGNMCESLQRLTPEFEIVPGLAESTEHPTPTTWVYRLRRGVRFWNGAPLEPADVVFSLRRQMDPKAGGYWGWAFQSVRSIAATGPREVTVTLRAPDVLFNQLMATAAGMIAQRAYVERHGRDYGNAAAGAMCTGPFEFGSWERGTSLTLRRNEDYWDADRRARAGELAFSFINNEATQTDALRSGQYDGQFDPPLSGLAQLRDSSAGTLFLGHSTRTLDIVVSHFDGALADRRVRQALALATPYDGIVDTVYSGTAEPLRALAPPRTWGYARDVYQAAWDALPEPRTDVDGAKALIEQAGRPRRPVLLAYPAEIQYYAQIAAAIQDGAKRAGLPVELRAIPAARYGALFNDPQARADVDAFLTTNYTDIPDPLEWYANLALPHGLNNFSGYSHPAVTAALTKALRTDDPQERAELVVAAQRQITRDLVWIPIVGVQQRVFLGKRVTGAQASSPFMYSAWAAGLGAR